MVGYGTISDMYATIARYYDAMHAQLTDDIGFILSLAGRVGGSVLECGCGTGRLILPLARAGIPVTGIDTSPAMLDLAIQKLRDEKDSVHRLVHLVEADMITFSLPDPAFSLAVVSFNTFMHLNRDDKHKSLKAIRRHLRPGGSLFLDLANPYAVAQTPNDHMLTLEQVMDNPPAGDKVLVFAQNHLDTPEQLLTVTWLFDRSPAGGGPVTRDIVQGMYHYLYPHEMDSLLPESGFTLIAYYGNYNQEPFLEDSERMLVLATRA